MGCVIAHWWRQRFPFAPVPPHGCWLCDGGQDDDA